MGYVFTHGVETPRYSRKQLKIIAASIGGRLNIPTEIPVFDEPAKLTRDDEFTLTPGKLRYIKRHEVEPWIDRAFKLAFWQCWLCGWKPFPVPVIVRGVSSLDDSAWPWFSTLHPKTRAAFVEISAELQSANRFRDRRRKSFGAAKTGSDIEGLSIVRRG